MTIRVLIVDDHAGVRDGIQAALATTSDIAVVGSCGDGAEVTATAQRVCPDVVIMDLLMPGTDGAEATRLLLADRPRCRVVILTASPDGLLAEYALAAGASSCVAKGGRIETLIAAVRAQR